MKAKKYNLQNIYKIIFLSLLFVFFLGNISFAESNSSGMSEQANDKSNEPTVITADTMELDLVVNLITLEGSVVVNYPESKISSDLMYVYLVDDKDKAKKKKKDDELGGAGGGQKLDKIIAIGHVEIVRIMPEIDGEPQPRQKAVGGHAVYDTKKGTIVLTKKPMLIYGDGSYVSGNRITLWKDSDRLKVEGNRSAGRLSRLVLTPQDQEQLGGEDEEDVEPGDE